MEVALMACAMVVGDNTATTANATGSPGKGWAHWFLYGILVLCYNIVYWLRLVISETACHFTALCFIDHPKQQQRLESEHKGNCRKILKE